MESTIILNGFQPNLNFSTDFRKTLTKAHGHLGANLLHAETDRQT